MHTKIATNSVLFLAPPSLLELRAVHIKGLQLLDYRMAIIFREYTQTLYKADVTRQMIGFNMVQHLFFRDFAWAENRQRVQHFTTQIMSKSKRRFGLFWRCVENFCLSKFWVMHGNANTRNKILFVWHDPTQKNMIIRF